MAFAPDSFVNVEVVEFPLGSDPTANALFIVTGVAEISFSADDSGWKRDNLEFTVPAEGVTSPIGRGGKALDLGTVIHTSAVAFPAAVQGGNIKGWGIDRVDTIANDDGTVQLTARVAVRDGSVVRVGFQVNVLAFPETE